MGTDTTTRVPHKNKAPRHRIVWNHSIYTAHRDTNILKKWEQGDMPTVTAAYHIARNNSMLALSNEDFIENAHWLGYYQAWERLHEF